MDIKNTAITATMVIQSLVKLLENENVDISSVKFKVGSESEGYESPEFKLEKLIDLAYEGLEKIKEHAIPEGFVLVPELSANYLFNKVPELGFKHQDEKDTVLYHLNYMASEFKESAKNFVALDYEKQQRFAQESQE